MNLPFNLPSGTVTADTAGDMTLDDMNTMLCGMPRYNGAMWNKQAAAHAAVAQDSELISSQDGDIYVRANHAHSAKVSGFLARAHTDAVLSVGQHIVQGYWYLVRIGADTHTLRMWLLHEAEEPLLGDWTKPMQLWLKAIIGDEAFAKLMAAKTTLRDKIAIARGGRPYLADMGLIIEVDTRLVANEYACTGHEWPDGVDMPEPLPGVEYEPLTPSETLPLLKDCWADLTEREAA